MLFIVSFVSVICYNNKHMMSSSRSISSPTSTKTTRQNERSESVAVVSRGSSESQQRGRNIEAVDEGVFSDTDEEVEITVDDSELITFPRKFFGDRGQCPKTREEAREFWQWRIPRLDHREARQENPTEEDAGIMFDLMKKIHKELKTSIAEKYGAKIKKCARKKGLMRRNMSSLVTSEEDIMAAMSGLKLDAPNYGNCLLVVDIFYHPFTRDWLARKIDIWFAKRKFRLLEEPQNQDDQPIASQEAAREGAESNNTGKNEAEKKRRNHACKRGGWSAVARSGKSDECSKYMNALFRNQHWKIIHSKNKEVEGCKYTKLSDIMEMPPKYNNYEYWLVERKVVDEGGDGNSKSILSADAKPADEMKDLIKEVNRIRKEYGMQKEHIISLIESDEEELEGKVVKYSSAADGHVSELTDGINSKPNHDPKSPRNAGIPNNGNAQETPFSLTDSVPGDHGPEQYDDVNEDAMLKGPVLSPATANEHAVGVEAGCASKPSAKRVLNMSRNEPSAAPARQERTYQPFGARNGRVPEKQPRSRLQPNEQQNKRKRTLAGQQQDDRSSGRNKIHKTNLKNPAQGAPSGTPTKKKSKQSPISKPGSSPSSVKERENASMQSDPCDHHDISNFITEERPSYFTASYQKKNKFMADMCGDCKKKLGPEGYKVGEKTPVYLCTNAKKHSHVCKLAYCMDCYGKRIVEPNSSRNKKKDSDAAKQAECHHKELNTYSEDSNASYYVQGYYDKNPNSASHCAECQKKFGPEGYKVGSSTQVYLCENARSLYHTCKHAYCKECYLAKIMKSDDAAGRGRRSSRRSRS